MAQPTRVSTTLLHNVPLFAGLNEQQLGVLARAIVRKSVGRNVEIIGAGDPTDSLYIVISGRLKVLMGDEQGREVILSILGPGEFFGELALLSPAPRSATAAAIEAAQTLSVTRS